MFWSGISTVSVSLPRFGGWRALVARGAILDGQWFQSRCRDLGVGESSTAFERRASFVFQSRCRDLGVGESAARPVVIHE